jgi:hypothetical protein
VRCSRCQRSLSINDSSTPAPGVVQFGMNSYYCSRCASMVGFNDRWTTVYISNAKRHWRKLGHHNITGLFAYCLSTDRSISGTNHSRGLGEIYTRIAHLHGWSASDVLEGYYLSEHENAHITNIAPRRLYLVELSHTSDATVDIRAKVL